MSNLNVNEAQRTAICHNKGPMLVLAGPGSGKTLVITQRTRYLIEECGVNPSNILVITFTKAAATEMKERFVKLMGGENLPVTFGTFHAVFFRMLRLAYGYTAQNILRDEQRIQFLKEIFQQMKLEIDDESEFIGNITAEISKVKSERIPLEHYYSTSCGDEIFRDIYQKYDQRLIHSNLIDFDDMLVMCYELLTQRKDILSVWQKKFTYILIDEFQDISGIQYDNIKLLAAPENNLFIVGDDDQSIYRFRGAKPEIMLNFPNDYKNAKQVLLNKNYRSTSQIVEGAKQVIKNNKKRFSKEFEASNGEGERIRIQSFQTTVDECTVIAKEIVDYVNHGGKYSDVAVLFRTNTQPRSLVQKLMEYNIPFRMREMMPNLFGHWIAKDIFTYIRLAKGSNLRKDFFEIMNRPKRYLSRESLPDEEVNYDKWRYYYRDKDWMVDRIDKLYYDLSMMKKMPPYAAIQYIRQAVEYESYLEEYAKFRRMKPEELFEVLDEIQESAKEYQTYEEWFAYIDEYSKEMEEQSKKQQTQYNCVSLATMHSSKGLEYKIVYIIDANETITPHKKSVTEADIEEERRLFYVAMTRAKEKLSIFYVQKRFEKELSPSRFLCELLVDKEKLKPGAAVYHKKYGAGIIRKVEEDRITIFFADSKRTLVFNKEFCINNHVLQLKK